MFTNRVSYSLIALISAIFGGSAATAASLPIVNIGAGAVSARAMFGEDVEVRKTYFEPTKAVHMAKDNSEKQVTTRATKPAPVAKSLQMGDILNPQRPTNDIWAKNDGRNINSEPPLRMPKATEFAVLKGDFALPEESLDYQIEKMTEQYAAKKVTARNATVAKTAPVEAIGYADDIFARASEPTKIAPEHAVGHAPESKANNELAELTQSFKRLEAQIARMESAAPAAQPVQKVVEVREIIREVERPQVIARASVMEPVELVETKTIANTRTSPIPEIVKRGDVTVQRIVVPLEDDFAFDYQTNDIQTARADDKKSAPKKIVMAESKDDFEYKGDVPLSKLSPTQLKKAFQKTYLSENKYLSTYQIDDRFDVVSTVENVGFDSGRDLSEKGGIRPLEVKIAFRSDDSALSRDNYNLLTEYASIVVSNPKRAIQVSIPEQSTRSLDDRKLAARRLAIVEQVLKDTGVLESRIVPVLSQRADDAFVLRIISNDQFETLTSGTRDMFGDTINSKTYKSMKW